MSRPSPSANPSLLYRVGLFCHRRRGWIVLAWMAAFVLLLPQIMALGGRMSSGGFEVPGSQSDGVTRIVEEEFTGQFQFSDLLVLTSDELPADHAEFQAVFEDVRTALLDAPGVGAVSDPYASPQQSISPDGRTISARVGLTDDQDQALDHSEELEAAVAAAAEGTRVEAYITGAAPFYRAFQETAQHDLESAERIGLPISLVILIVAFGSLVAAGMPLIMAGLGLAVAFGLISLLADVTVVSVFTQNIASMIGLGVGIDFSLFIITRFRERLKAGSAIDVALGESLATSGKAVFVSGVTTVVALSGTLLVNMTAFRSMGMGAMLAVGVAVAAALTLLPALLAMIGVRVNALRTWRTERASSGMWHRWATFVMRRPWPAMIIGVLIIAVLTAPALELRMASSGFNILPEDSQPRVAAEVAAEAFGEGQVAPAQILIRHDEPVTEGGFADVYEVARVLAADPEVIRVDSIATLVPDATIETAQGAASMAESAPFIESIVGRDGRTTILSAVTRHGAQGVSTGDFVGRMRKQLPETLGERGTVLVGGDPGLEVDITNELSSKLPYVVGLVLVLSFFVLLLFLRSLLLPIKAIFLNLASVTAAYGVLVLVFQKGYGASLLGFEAETGAIDPFIPLFLFCILFGLSMDYEVFLLSRIKEEYTRSRDNTSAVGWGLEHTARIITSAALIMITVFGAFAFTTLIPIKAMGFGLAVAVFVDASLIRVVLVPATMRLMGDWNWWLPEWMDRILPTVSIEESLEQPGEIAPVS
ncbi:MAG: MMPL family transporter [Actinomycetota bacterium]